MGTSVYFLSIREEGGARQGHCRGQPPTRSFIDPSVGGSRTARWGAATASHLCLVGSRTRVFQADGPIRVQDKGGDSLFCKNK